MIKIVKEATNKCLTKKNYKCRLRTKLYNYCYHREIIYKSIIFYLSIYMNYRIDYLGSVSVLSDKVVSG